MIAAIMTQLVGDAPIVMMFSVLGVWIFIVLSEVLIVFHLVRLRRKSYLHFRALGFILNCRIGVLIAFLGLIGLQLSEINIYRVIEFASVLIPCSLLTAYFWTSFCLLGGLRHELDVQDMYQQEVDCFPPRSIASFGLLVLVYHFLMNVGRGFSYDATVVVTNAKDAVGYLMLAVAGWVLISIMLSAIRLRRDAKKAGEALLPMPTS